MSHKRSRAATLVGLAAATGAVGVAAIMSAVSGPTARADAYSDIINAVDADFAFGQTAFTVAYSDLVGNAQLPALVEFLDGVDDDSLSAPNSLLVGTVEALSNEPINTGFSEWEFSAPASFADALTQAQTDISNGQSYFADAVTAFTAGEYGTAAYSDLYGMDLTSIVPLQELLLGSALAL